MLKFWKRLLGEPSAQSPSGGASVQMAVAGQRMAEAPKAGFRYSIRELMLVTLAVSMALGWGLERRQLNAKYRKASDKAASLEHIFTLDGWKLEWTADHSHLHGERKPRKSGEGVTSFDFP